jgi:hypothetical protein
MKGAVLRFGEDYALWVKETPREVEAAIVNGAAAATPLLHFTLNNDSEIAVNPSQIWTIAEQP